VETRGPLFPVSNLIQKVSTKPKSNKNSAAYISPIDIGL